MSRGAGAGDTAGDAGAGLGLAPATAVVQNPLALRELRPLLSPGERRAATVSRQWNWRLARTAGREQRRAPERGPPPTPAQSRGERRRPDGQQDAARRQSC